LVGRRGKSDKADEFAYCRRTKKRERPRPGKRGSPDRFNKKRRRKNRGGDVALTQIITQRPGVGTSGVVG